MRYLRDDIVETFDMLDVHRGVDVDPGIQQLLNVLVAFGVTAAGDVGVSKLVDQQQLWPALEGGIEIELAQDAVDVDDRLAWQNLQALQQSLRLLSPVRLGHADDNVYSLLHLGARRLQHLVGLADTGRGANEDFEPANTAFFLASSLGKEGLGRGTIFRAASLLSH